MRRPGDEQLGLDLESRAPSPPPPPPPAGVTGAPEGTPFRAAATADFVLPALPDAAARRRITGDLDANLLVEAGAGSGKTSELVSRMVALVREGAAAVTEIAAVTFTRKAAGELRERFQEALESERTRDDLAQEARDRVESALHDIDRTFIGTIHSFCARLLRERPLEAGIDPGFVETTATEAALLTGRYWSLHLERLAAVGDPILGELEDIGLEPPDLRGLYQTLCDHLDVEFPVEPLPPPDPAAVAEVQAEVDAILDEGWRLMPREEPDGGWDELQQRLRSVDYTRKYRAWQDNRVFLDALAELCSRKSWKVTQYKWSAERSGKAAAKRLGERMNALLAGSARRLLDEWWTYRYPIALSFAWGAARALESHRRSRGMLDFQDLLSLAAELLRGSPAARRDLGRRWRRLLVDEFQDTDPIQAEVLFLLASDPEEDGGDWTRSRPRPGALFVVGDPKQSIYRFRRADIALYMRVRDRFAALGGVQELVANFRSGEPVAALVNDVFAPPEGFPAKGHSAQAAFAPLLPQPRRELPPLEGVFHYHIRSEDSSKVAITDWGAPALADWIARRTGPEGDRKPGDFLILTRNKKPLEAYARALEARNLPVQVSGAGVGVEEEVSELEVLLEALADPDDASKTVAVLVGLFFGVDHEQLLEHREAGKGFDFRSAWPHEARGPVEAALAQMHGWWERARQEPADVVVGRIASDLGLLAHAAAGELGSIRAGALAYVLDAVRGAGLGGNTSLSGALEALKTALADDEAETPLEPGRADQIRLMNLHKAKGLEGRVVVLADPSAEWEHPVERHIERTPDGRATGWLAVERRDGPSKRVLARPRGWEEKVEAERSFREAEELRLLYVAATRAEHELVVARHSDTSDKSPWRRLHAWLDTHGTTLELTPAPAPDRERADVSAETLVRAGEAAAQARSAARAPSYAFASVTGVARSGGTAPPEPPTETILDPGDGPGGQAWGSAVHGVLEAAARGASGDRLRALGRSLLLELDRPVKDGEPTELDVLMATAEGVLTSELWERARRTERCMAEVPFVAAPAELSGAAAGAAGDVTPTYLEGIIDLAFREPDGWVIVDYKTDRGDDPEFPARRRAYREQLRLYGRAWERLTGEPVKERLLWFVRGGTVEGVERE